MTRDHVRSTGGSDLRVLNFMALVLSAVHLFLTVAEIVRLFRVMSPENMSVKSVDDMPAALSIASSPGFMFLIRSA